MCSRLVGTALSRLCPSDKLWQPKPPLKRREIHQPARMAAFADLTRLVKGFDLKTDNAALHRDHFRARAHGRADGRRREMAHIDFGADRDPAGLQATGDGI